MPPPASQTLMYEHVLSAALFLTHSLSTCTAAEIMRLKIYFCVLPASGALVETFGTTKAITRMNGNETAVAFSSL